MAWRVFVFSWLFATALVFGSVPKAKAIEDTTLLRWLLRDEAPTGILPLGDWSMAPVSDSNLRLILFKNGTEYKRLPASQTEQMLRDYPDYFSDTTSPRAENIRPSLQRSRPDWSWIRSESFDRLDGIWFQQDEGVDIGRQIYGSRGQRWWIQDQYYARVAKIFGSTRFSVGLISSTDYMNIQREIRKYYGSSEFSDYSWQFALTWKAFTYQLQSWTYVLPEYYWFEESVDTLWAASRADESKKSKGEVVSQFYNASDSSLDAGFSSNFTHRFEARLWHMRYSILFDDDLYTSAVHRIGIEDLENPLGTWGAFVVGCNGVWVPGMWLEVGPAFSLKMPLSSWDHLSWFPFRFEMMYENTSHFRIYFGSRIHWGGK